MMDKKNLLLLAAFLAGVVFANKVRTLPVVSKLPSF